MKWYKSLRLTLLNGKRKHSIFGYRMEFPSGFLQNNSKPRTRLRGRRYPAEHRDPALYPAGETASPCPTTVAALSQLLYEPLNTGLATFIKDLVRTAIIYHEPRITLERIDLEVNPDREGVINISIDYTIKATNSRTNYVYPFYLKEGTDIRRNQLPDSNLNGIPS